ncbi:hypothetical protein [Streptomyces roseoverticillatus]|uniref:Uncharacterized protein n=1 Tax=Streptomyces roseoverticillatus TaxID=66429 RepID=A0ABV3J3A6_9ACTN
MVLSAHTSGITFKELSKSRGLPLHVLTVINQSLMAELQADSPTHAVRRGWQYGPLPRDGAPAGPGAEGRNP